MSIQRLKCYELWCDRCGSNTRVFAASKNCVLPDGWGYLEVKDFNEHRPRISTHSHVCPTCNLAQEDELSSAS